MPAVSKSYPSANSGNLYFRPSQRVSLQLILYLFWAIALLNIIGEWTELLPLRIATKPLLMIVLGIWYYQATVSHRTITHKFILVALGFSWLGDVLLMNETEVFFLLGLVSFLITHVLYILGFRREINLRQEPTLIRRQPLAALPIVLLFGGLLLLLFNHIPGEMKIPVVIYSSVITLMVIIALNRCGRVSQESFRLVFTGAVLFMLSDSLIAINKFYFNDTLWKAGFFIMLLYIAGQYLIARGTSKTG